jgi:yeast amino acid transporter
LCFAHIRFRSAIKAQAHRGELALEDLPYRAIFGVYGSWIGFILCCLCIAATIYTACNPGGDFSVEGFFQETLALPIVVFCYVLWKVWKRPSIVKSVDADLVSGRREHDLKAEKDKENMDRATWGPIKRYVSIPSAMLISVFTDSYVNPYLSVVSCFRCDISSI